MTTETKQPDLITEVEELLANPTKRVGRTGYAYELLRRLVEEVKLRRRSASSDAVIQKIEIMQERYPGQRIEISVESDGYCYVTRVNGNGKTRPIAEGATMGDVFED